MAATTSYPKDKIKILLLEGVHDAAIRLFESCGYKSVEVVKGALSGSALAQKVKTAHLLGIRSKTRLTAEIFLDAPKLLAAGAFCIGTNQIDLQAATRSGVTIFNSPYSNTRSVAEMVIGLSISLLRKVPEKNAAAHRGEWLKSSDGCREVRGKTLGIIGYGHIGSQVSVMAESIGMRVIFFDVEPKLIMGNARQVNSLDQLLKQSDIVTLHVPGLNSTSGMMDSAKLKKMKPGSVLINLSRGDVVDLAALKHELLKGHIAGAGIDVFTNEPEKSGDAFNCILSGLPNVVLTPHIGGSTLEAQENIGVDVASKLISFLETGSTTGSLSVPPLSLPVQQEAHRLLHIHKNVPGVLGQINGLLSKLKVNILGQYLKTNNEIGYVVLDVDKKTSAKALTELKKIKQTIKVRELY